MGNVGNDRRDGASNAVPPEIDAIGDQVVERVTTFARDLRRSGATVSANAGIDGTRALATVGFRDRQRARAALRATLISRKEDLDLFETLFPQFWDDLTDTLDDDEFGAYPPEPDPTDSDEFDRPVPEGEDDDSPTQQDASDRREEEFGNEASGEDQSDQSDPEAAGEEPAGMSEGDDAEGDDEASRSSDSSTERLGISDDGEDDDDAIEASVYSQAGSPEPITIPDVSDVTGLEGAMQELTDAIATLRGRRWTDSSTGDHLDTRRALRRSFATGGSIPDVPRRTRQTSDVQCLLLVDVSQSVLDTIDRGFLVRFLRSAVESWRSVRIFFFDTSVREVTSQFEAPSTAAAVRALGRAEAEWGGGTRIGYAVDSIRRDDPHAVDRTTTTFVISDGLEVGETDRLERGMAWLASRSNAVLWLNPLASSPEYEPSCRGMAVSMPYVDGLFAFSGPDDVTEIARQLRLRGCGGRIGYRYDPRSEPSH
ncbi:VWA domain-containing protein (plasmid) [Natrialbaceae archaeon A-arb3/5]